MPGTKETIRTSVRQTEANLRRPRKGSGGKQAASGGTYIVRNLRQQGQHMEGIGMQLYVWLVSNGSNLVAEEFSNQLSS